MLGLTSKPMIVLALIVVGLIALAVIARNWGCRPEPKPIVREREVASVLNGATILVKAGLRDRRSETVTLQDIATPESSSPFSEASRANLERLAGATIRVEVDRHGLFRGEPEEMESRGPICGTVYGESNVCCNLAQVMAGMASCLPSADKVWKAAETKAKKEKLGIWGK
jgi:endonuclease YncB( thermonuclease family)